MKETLIYQDLDFQKSRCRLNGRVFYWSIKTNLTPLLIAFACAPKMPVHSLYLVNSWGHLSFKNRFEQKIASISFQAFNPFKQSHYREVAQWEIFMEQELRFGLDLGQLALLKKKHLGRLWLTFEAGFIKFSWAKK